MFALAAVLMLGLAAALVRWLPATPPSAVMSYGALLRSLWPLMREQPVVRDAALLGALNFAAFSAFWTTLAFRLATPPLHHGGDVAGLFGLLGIAGALTAPLAGRFADRASPRRAIGAAVGINLLAWIALLLGGRSLAGLAIGVVLLDAGTQGAQVSNQARVYALPAHAHSRLNTIYMVAYFVGGAIGSVLGATAWTTWGWAGVCGFGLLVTGVAGAVLAFKRDEPRAA
jgi:predicted MFS family arabinose efflux permease